MLFMRLGFILFLALVFFQKTTFANSFPLIFEDGLLRPGQTVSIPVTAGSALDLHGFQFELHFDPSIFTIIEIIPSKLPELSIRNFTQPSPGVLTGNWTNFDGKLLESGTLLFTLILKVAKPGLIHDVFKLSNETIQSEAYDDGDEAYDLSLAFSPPSGGALQIQKSEIFSAQPNPAISDVKIPIWLTSETLVTLNLYDLSGKIIHTQKIMFDRGAQHLLIPIEVMGNVSTYFWEVRLGTLKKQGCLVRI
jgi:hypothetical protein